MQEASAETHGAGLTASLRVLVVDDLVDAADLLVEIVGSWGHEASAVYNGEGALRSIAAGRPDVVLLDLGLPRMDGFEVARRIRANPALADVRLIAVTGYAGDAERRRARAAGFDAHLVKPVDLEALRALLVG